MAIQAIKIICLENKNYNECTEVQNPRCKNLH